LQSLGAGSVRGYLDDGVDTRVDRIDTLKVRLDDLDRRQASVADGRGKLACGGSDHFVESVHGYLL